MVRKICNSNIKRKNKDPNDSIFPIWSWRQIRREKWIFKEPPRRVLGFKREEEENEQESEDLEEKENENKNRINKKQKKSIFNVDFFV